MIELVNKIFNGKEYTLVDEYDDIIENELVYHFSSETDDLFCVKVNDEYKEITDEKTINLIKELCDLFPPEVIFNKEKQNIAMSLLMRITAGVKGAKKLSKEEKEEFYDVQIKQLKKAGIDIDFSKLKDRLINTGNVYMCDELDGMTLGFFHPGTNSTFVYESDSYDDSTSLHESIHKATGPVQCITLPSFFVEGGAVSIVEKVYGNKGTSKIGSLTTKDGSKRSVRYNFNLTGTSYYDEVCLLKQIEYAVGYSADKDVLSGTRDILDDFSDRYGKDVLRYAKHVGNQITRGRWKGSYEKMIKAQNLILERVFNKEFPQELTMENAQEYLRRLQGMELHRARIEVDEYFKEFYEDKHRIIKQQLLEKGYELSEVEEKIPQYIPAEFYPTQSEKMMRKEPISYLAEKLVKPYNIARNCVYNKISSIDHEDFKIFVMRRDDLFLEFFTYKGMIWEGKAIKDSKNIYIDAQRNTRDEKTEENTVYYDLESDSLKFDENGETYEFEEADVSEEYIEKINSEIQMLEELRKNAMEQRNSEVQSTKRNLFQKIKEWINMKKNNRVQEEPTKDANDQR